MQGIKLDGCFPELLSWCHAFYCPFNLKLLTSLLLTSQLLVNKIQVTQRPSSTPPSAGKVDILTNFFFFCLPIRMIQGYFMTSKKKKLKRVKLSPATGSDRSNEPEQKEWKCARWYLEFQSCVTSHLLHCASRRHIWLRWSVWEYICHPRNPVA